MAVRFFSTPIDQGVFPSVNKNILITGGAVAAIKSTVFNIKLGDIELEEPVGYSDYGTPILDVIEFPEGNYYDLEGNIISFGGIREAAVILEVSQTKNIVKTAIQGRNGTVKEYVSDGDYVINARGILTSPKNSNAIPLDRAIAFREIMSVPQQIDIVSQYLNEVFGINQIVIESFDMPQLEGFRNQIPFTFQALSDTPINLEELE